MPAILVNHRVADFKNWLKVYEEHEPVRRAASATNSTVWQAEGDPNNVFIVIECTDLAKIKAFGQSEDLKQTMLKAGVIGMPTITVLAESFKYPRQAGQRA